MSQTQAQQLLSSLKSFQFVEERTIYTKLPHVDVTACYGYLLQELHNSNGVNDTTYEFSITVSLEGQINLHLNCFAGDEVEFVMELVEEEKAVKMVNDMMELGCVFFKMFDELLY